MSYSLALAAVLKDPLNHPATVRVGGEGEHLPVEGINDKLNLLRGDPLDALLDDMIAILVLDAAEDVAVELFDHSDLMVKVDLLQGLLDDPAAVHLERELQNMASSFRGEHRLLVIVAVLEKLLDDVVPKNVGHQLEGGGEDLVKHHLLLDILGRFELLLDEPRAVLVTAELDNVTNNIWQLVFPDLVVAELLQERGADDTDGGVRGFGDDAVAGTPTQ